MSSTYDDLLVALGFEYDPAAAKKFSEDLDGLVNLATKAGKAVIGATAAIVGFTIATSAASDEQGKLADEVGVSVGQIDALQFANKRAGGSADEMTASLRSLSGKIGEAARGTGSGIEAFGMLGISVQGASGQLKSADNMLIEISDRMRGMSKGQQIELAEKLGVSGSIRLLQQGSKEIRGLINEAHALGTTTAEDAELGAQFQDSLTDIWQIVKHLSRVIARSLIPVMEKVANKFTEWWKANKDMIEQNMPMWIEKITFGIKVLTLAFTAFMALRLATMLFELITLFKGLSLSALAANAAVMALPMFIAAVIAGIALLAEDAHVFFEGGESFIGNMIAKYPQWKDAIVAVAAVFATLYDLTLMIFDGWGKIFAFFSSGTVIDDFKLVVKQIGIDIMQLFKDMGNWVAEAFLGALQKVKDKISDLADDVKNIFSFDGISDTLSSIFGKPQEIDATVNAEAGKNPLVDRVINPVSKYLADDVPVMPKMTIGDMTKQRHVVQGNSVEQNASPSLTGLQGNSVEQNASPNIVVQNFAKDQKTAIPPSGGSATSIENSSSNFSSADTTNNSSTSSQTSIAGGIHINVDGSSSPDLTAKAIHEELKNIIEQSSTNLNSAVDL